MPQAKVELALNKLDAVRNNAIDDVFVILKDLDNMPALVTELAESGATGNITELVEWVLGKYAFTECKNIETIELPAKDGFVILNAAFEDCYNLKSVYIRGNQPIEGTADVSILH